ncbi:hypothetical protein [Alteromonas macleodii]|uniref:hypothetical protein n=1 Tax=Alteromonas macleodii TaxID=28108 RepID=UPI003140323D|tara:strand:- start:156500 stop:157030 length:531 start_codon:yes stop_codon:yes gene_type:complete
MKHFKNINHILDITELQESVLLIALATAQIEASMTEGDYSVNALIDSFKSMSSSLRSILKEDNDNPKLEQLKKDIDLSIVSFQFYDRLNQRLEHVNNSLVMLSTLVSDDAKLKDPMEWDSLKNKIRKSYSMESEHDLFKLLYDEGLSVKDALKNIKETTESSRSGASSEDDDIELF